MFSRLFTPDTVDYMIAGYVVISVGISLYITSLVLRWQKTVKAYNQYKKDLDQ